MTTDSGPVRIRQFKKAFEAFCGLLLFLAVTVSLVEIVARAGFGLSFDLFFDIPVWLTVWSLLLITGLLLADDEHISINYLRNKLSGRPRWCLEVLLALTSLAYGAFITWGSILFLRQLYAHHEVFPRYFAVPKWIVELCVPIGMMIFTCFALAGLIKAVRRRW
ncbi:MAG: TRAP transporter small permease [Thermodesulfobacteriota bacterium]